MFVGRFSLSGRRRLNSRKVVGSFSFLQIYPRVGARKRMNDRLGKRVTSSQNAQFRILQLQLQMPIRAETWA